MPVVVSATITRTIVTNGVSVTRPLIQDEITQMAAAGDVECKKAIFLATITGDPTIPANLITALTAWLS